MRDKFTKEALPALMQGLAESSPAEGSYRIYLVGGGTAVAFGWRGSSVDADLAADDDTVFKDIQALKERLNLNIEFARPEDFVPALAGSASRHVFISRLGNVSFYHYDPYAQAFSKIVRGFERDLTDARHFVDEGLVDPYKLVSLVRGIPEAEFARYPSLSRGAVLDAVHRFMKLGAAGMG